MIESGRTFGNSISDSPICVAQHDARTYIVLYCFTNTTPHVCGGHFLLTLTDAHHPRAITPLLLVVYARQTSAESLGNIGQPRTITPPYIVFVFAALTPHASPLTRPHTHPISERVAWHTCAISATSVQRVITRLFTTVSFHCRPARCVHRVGTSLQGWWPRSI